MKRKRYSDEQIAFAMRQTENGTPTSLTHDFSVRSLSQHSLNLLVMKNGRIMRSSHLSRIQEIRHGWRSSYPAQPACSRD